MNRTAIFLGTAAVLALLALIPFNETVREQPLPPAPAPAPEAQAVLSDDAGPARLEGKLSASAVAAPNGQVYARFRVVASDAAPAKQPRRNPVSIVAVIDRSGSMAGEKLAQAKVAAQQLVEMLHDGDSLGIIDYGSDVEAMTPLRISPATRGQLIRFIGAIQSSGGTNISAALTSAMDVLARDGGDYAVRRAILLSDGQPTEGDISDQGLLRAADLLRERRVALSAIGIGLDFNERLMSSFAQHGGGFFGFLKDASGLAEIFNRELNQANLTVARAVSLTLEPEADARIREVLGYPAAQRGQAIEVPLYDLTPGQTAHVMVAMDVFPTSNKVPVVRATLHYEDPATGAVHSARVSLEATRAESAAAADASVNRDVRADALRAEGGKQLAQAAVELNNGNRQGALSIFANVRQLFAADAQALAGDIRSLGSSAEALAGNDLSNGEAAKIIVRKNLSNFGSNNSY